MKLSVHALYLGIAVPEFRDTARGYCCLVRGVASLRVRRVYSVGPKAANKVFEGISAVPKLEAP